MDFIAQEFSFHFYYPVTHIAYFCVVLKTIKSLNCGFRIKWRNDPRNDERNCEFRPCKINHV